MVGFLLLRTINRSRFRRSWFAPQRPERLVGRSACVLQSVQHSHQDISIKYGGTSTDASCIFSCSVAYPMLLLPKSA
ncbi:hypothetical protein OH76DRAFT_300514 [Lentinus brumalis]|uniref:Uncharacterized protein n=1 Tax=Lentinus brumalis TaxID=2498619 RepID=A0A371DG96_9APHY|nr:hypothetical protein OH76DRAFT_300514 [Polyporus brumalis]